MSKAFPIARLAASIAVWHDGHVALIQRGKPPLEGVWSLPGGHVELGEQVADAARRELLEETGLECSDPVFVKLNQIVTRDNAGLVMSHYVIAVHTAFYKAGTLLAGDDAKAADWVRPEELPGLPTTPELATLLTAAQAVRHQVTG